MQGRRNLGATPAIRNLNRGHHNIRFDRPNRFGVACSALSHFGSSRFFFFNCREQGTVLPGAEWRLRFWGEVTFQAGACGRHRSACSSRVLWGRLSPGAGELF